jgi:hypothetical protein
LDAEKKEEHPKKINNFGNNSEKLEIDGYLADRSIQNDYESSQPVADNGKNRTLQNFDGNIKQQTKKETG